MDSYRNSSWLTFNYTSMMVWFCNLVMIFLCFLKLFVFGDYPAMSTKSQQADDFWLHRKQAEFNISKVIFVYL